MKKLKLSITFLSVLLGSQIFAQSSQVIKSYIETYKDIAIAEMQRTGVPAAITLAQGIHETGAGTSDLVRRSNNHFGIKCKSDWKGESVSHDDDARGECFRKYNDPYESYRDHSDFLKYRPYYTDLFKLDPTDYEGWAYGLKKAGYATNPKYPQILIKLIKDYNLQDYTMIALNKETRDELVWASNKEESASDEEAKTELNEPVEDLALRTKYPSGVFKINETKVVLVYKGTSFLKIAEEHKLNLSRLFEFNDMKPVDVAERDQLIYLQRKRKTGANEFHLVAEGETLHSIAQTEAIRIEMLAEYNLLELHMHPATGEKLHLRSRAGSMPKLKEEKKRVAEMPAAKNEIKYVENETSFVWHVVQAKETDYSISKKYLVAIDDLMKWNELETTGLRTGQKIRINKNN